MTPEEFDRRVEFILETQAHLSASLDREHEQREERLAESERMQKNLAGLQTQVVNMIRVESERLDRSDRWLGQAQRSNEKVLEEILQLLRRNEDFQRNALALLGRILDRLPPFTN